MDPRERSHDIEELIRSAMQSMRAGLWTAMPGRIVFYDSTANTATVQLGIRAVGRGESGRQSAVSIPVLPDVPIVFPHGGGATLTFPIAAGDEVLVVFASRCIDAWWQSGGEQLPFEPRMHDLSDGFAIPGPMSQVKKISGISTATVQLRSDDGAAFVEIDPASHAVNVTTTGVATVTAPSIVLAGNVHITGSLQVDEAATLTGAVTTGASMVVATTLSINGDDFGGHEHTGVKAGSDISGGVA
jgi:phage baseplate assembly protein V